MISVAIRHQRYTLRGIRQNLTFSVNVPSTDIVRETDYCRIISGSKVDKVEICQFNVFYGKLDNAPLIEQCPVNLECKVVRILDLGSHSLIVGRIEETYVSQVCLTDGKPDVNKIKPLIYCRTPARHYQAVLVNHFIQNISTTIDIKFHTYSKRGKASLPFSPYQGEDTIKPSLTTLKNA